MNAYSNETAVRTTLVEGRLKVVNSKASAVLTPGKQAVLTAGSRLTIADADGHVVAGSSAVELLVGP